MTAILILLAVLFLVLALGLVLGVCRRGARADAALRAAGLVHEYQDASSEPDPESAAVGDRGTTRSPPA